MTRKEEKIYQKYQDIMENAKNGEKYGVNIEVYTSVDGYNIDIDGESFSSGIDLEELEEEVQCIVATLEYISPLPTRGSWVNLAIGEEEKAQFIGDLIDNIEDMLAEYNSTNHKMVSLPRTEQAKKADPDIGEDVVIAAGNYDELYGRFSDLLEGWSRKAEKKQPEGPEQNKPDNSSIYCIMHMYDQNSYTEPHYYEVAKDGLGEIVGYAGTRKEAEDYLNSHCLSSDPDDEDGSYYEIRKISPLGRSTGSQLPSGMAYNNPVIQMQDERKLKFASNAASEESEKTADEKADDSETGSKETSSNTEDLRKLYAAFWDLYDLMADNLPDAGDDNDPDVIEMVKEAGERFENDKETFEKAYNRLSGKNKKEPEEEKKDLWVTWRVEGRFHTHVKASSVEEARKLAEEAYYDADFGVLEDIGDCDTYDISVQDEEGNFLWER